MADFKETVNQIGNNIASYSNAAWQRLLQEANAEIAGLTIFNTLGDKKVTLLRSNLDYIKNSNDVVFGYTPEDYDDRVDFTYYREGSDKNEIPKPKLVDPHNDGFRKEVMKGGGFRVNDEFARKERTYEVVNGGEIVHTVYNEHNNDKTEMNKYLEGTKGIIERTNYDPFTQNGNGLAGKTNKWFRGLIDDVTQKYISERFKTVISRFHTSCDNSDIEEMKSSVGNSAFSEKYGMSHGRNLLKTQDGQTAYEDPKEPYDNPYCRVWTHHHQYNRFVKDTIRPFSGITNDELEKKYNWDSMRSSDYKGFGSGGSRLRKYGAMFDNDGNNTGLVNITPKSDGNGIKGPGGVDIRHCMFSIENLAWKGMFNDYSDEMEENGLSIDQKGPFGGRIMWFPPYNLKFSENSNATWEANEFIGRGEPIYTYSNTRRNGSLSFTMLVDHPSVLDYWERREEVGNSVKSGVDNIESKEQQMLRFFAGCDILKAKLPEQEPIVAEEKKIDEEPETEPESEMFQFLVFYPNNYSGKDDWKSGSIVNPIHYLMGGIGTQKEILDDDGQMLMDPEAYKSKNVHDFPIDFSKEYWVNGNYYGGYEIREKLGVSTIQTQTSGNVISTVTIQGSENDSQMTQKMLVKSLSDTAKKDSVTCTGLKGEKLKQWHKQRYYYRADEETLSQILIGDANDGAVSYIDKESHQFNSVNVKEAVEYWGLKSDKTYSLAEVFTVIEKDENARNYGKQFCREGKFEELKNIIDNYKDNITGVKFRGRASSQANNKSYKVNDERNTTLSRNRALTVKKWLMSTLGIPGEKISEDVIKLDIEYNYDKTKDERQDDSNDRDAKLNRFCLVEVYYKTDKTEDASQPQVRMNASGMPENNTIAVDNGFEGINNSARNKNELEEDETDRKVSARIDSRRQGAVDSWLKSGKFTKTIGTTRNKPKRYDDEYKFFNKIKENDPFMQKLLSERVKYFDPAFHSMSPEGFNARLTFLHQCTRQGPTFSAADSLNGNATNLSFGRPPVCILRVGDFYYTKIIINSISMDYDPLQWDLNDEGIGVMPMLANITIQFDFIGGSELSGPISRLQNALSYNYYANASVYDNRAEQVEYKSNTQGEIESFKAFIGQELASSND